MKKKVIALSLLAAAVVGAGVLAGCGSETPTEPVTEEQIVSAVVTEEGRQEEALARAKTLVAEQALSYEQTVQALGGEGYTVNEAVYGTSNCGADWDAQAVRKAEEYLVADPDMTADTLAQKLEADGFSEEEVQHGVDENRLLIRMEIA